MRRCAESGGKRVICRLEGTCLFERKTGLGCWYYIHDPTNPEASIRQYSIIQYLLKCWNSNELP